MAASEKPQFNNCYKAELIYNSSNPALFNVLTQGSQLESQLDSNVPVHVVYQRNQCSAEPIQPINPDASTGEPLVVAEDGDIRTLSQTQADVLYHVKQKYQQQKWRTIGVSREVVSQAAVGK
ncbi:hypothetical protein [Shewanella sp.]|uniref:hypothetical protein n=1 Tax=Shewanella sp. TaxID=50422 RepID=UPI003A97936D